MQNRASAMPAHVIVWDLETVPDLRSFAAANDLVGKSDDEIREVVRLRPSVNSSTIWG
jgi:hypothetical protein